MGPPVVKNWYKISCVHNVLKDTPLIACVERTWLKKWNCLIKIIVPKKFCLEIIKCHGIVFFHMCPSFLGDTYVPLRGYCEDRKSTRLNSSHSSISYAVFCLKKT